MQFLVEVKELVVNRTPELKYLQGQFASTNLWPLFQVKEREFEISGML